MSQAMGDSPEVAEIRIAVLDEVKKKVQRAGGKALFPYNIVRIVICTSAPDASVFQRDFFHRFFIDNPGVPRWWPGFCLAFDVVLAVWLTVRLGKHSIAR